MMHMEAESTVVPRLRVAVEAMPGRVTGLLRDRFSGLQVVLSREPPDRITAREVATVDIGVVGVVAVGGIADSLRPRQLLTIRRQL